ncbi:HAD family hydrolase [Saccharopolyspora sp. NPDC003762]
MVADVSARTNADVSELKPQPHLLLRAASFLGVSPERCVMIGDSATDIEAAQRAGTKCIAYANAGALRKRFGRPPRRLLVRLRSTSLRFWQRRCSPSWLSTGSDSAGITQTDPQQRRRPDWTLLGRRQAVRPSKQAERRKKTPTSEGVFSLVGVLVKLVTSALLGLPEDFVDLGIEARRQIRRITLAGLPAAKT